MFRVAAVGDLHVGVDLVLGQLRGGSHTWRNRPMSCSAGAPRSGRARRGRRSCRRGTRPAGPIVAVLGNHDDESIRSGCSRSGSSMWASASSKDRRRCSRSTRSVRSPWKGFAGGFAGACATALARERDELFAHASARRRGDGVRPHLARRRRACAAHPLRADPRDAAWGVPRALPDARQLPVRGARGPVRGRPAGPRPRARWDRERQTPGGIPVRNVAQPVLRRPYAVYGSSLAGTRHGAEGIGESRRPLGEEVPCPRNRHGNARAPSSGSPTWSAGSAARR